MRYRLLLGSVIYCVLGHLYPERAICSDAHACELQGTNGRILENIKTLRAETRAGVRIELMKSLARDHGANDAVLAEVVSHLADPSQEVRVVAMELLSSSFGPAAIAHLVRVIENKNMKESRWRALVALERIFRDAPNAEVSERLVRCLEDCLPDPDAGNICVGAINVYYRLLGRKEIDRSLPRIAFVFTTAKLSPGIRGSFNNVIASFGDKAVPYLKTALSSPDEDVRASSLAIVSRIGPAARPLLPEIEAALSDSYEWTRFYAGRAKEAVLKDASKR